MITVALCDDDPLQAQALQALVKAWAQQAQAQIKIRIYASAEAFLFADAEKCPANLLLLDVEMGGMSGIALAKELRRRGSLAEIVFITSHFEFIGEGYEVDALHYLTKPVLREKLFPVLDRARKRIGVQPPSLLLQSEGETIRLRQDEILYIEAFRHTVTVHTAQKSYSVNESISAVGERLGADFFAAHRSYFVNLKAIRAIARTHLSLENGAQIPLARGKYDAVNRAFIERN